jgi:AcrR family transcriptional regulator
MADRLAGPSRRLGRQERREQIIAAATGVFAASGFAASGLDEIAAAAGISKAILYRHFDSKTELYRAALDRARRRLGDHVTETPGAFTSASIDGLIKAAAADPDAFRLLFRHAVNEPEFRQEMQQFHAGMADIAHQQLSQAISAKAWARWASQLAPTMAIEAVLAWLDVGQPDPDQAPAMVKRAIAGITNAPEPGACP